MHDGVRTTRRGHLRTLAAAFGAVAIAVAAGDERAATAGVRGASDADVELVLLHGTKADAPSIPKDFPELANPPFNAYNHYEILSTKRLGLLKDKPTTEPLPDGSSLETTLLDKEKGDKFKLEVVVKDAKGALVSKGKYTAGKGARFMPVTLPYKGGNLVVSLKVL